MGIASWAPGAHREHRRGEVGPPPQGAGGRRVCKHRIEARRKAERLSLSEGQGKGTPWRTHGREGLTHQQIKRTQE